MNKTQRKKNYLLQANVPSFFLYSLELEGLRTRINKTSSLGYKDNPLDIYEHYSPMTETLRELLVPAPRLLSGTHRYVPAS